MTTHTTPSAPTGVPYQDANGRWRLNGRFCKAPEATQPTQAPAQETTQAEYGLRPVSHYVDMSTLSEEDKLRNQPLARPSLWKRLSISVGVPSLLAFGIGVLAAAMGG